LDGIRSRSNYGEKKIADTNTPDEEHSLSFILLKTQKSLEVSEIMRNFVPTKDH
jgi:hypothetical protein